MHNFDITTVFTYSHANTPQPIRVCIVFIAPLPHHCFYSLLRSQPKSRNAPRPKTTSSKTITSF